MGYVIGIDIENIIYHRSNIITSFLGGDVLIALRDGNVISYFKVISLL